MRGVGLDSTYGAYVDLVPAPVLASLNAMSMFGLNRRLLGAIVGHLAAFEMTSSLPNRMYGDGFRRLGFGEDVTDYFDEHVEADAVHEQIAARDLAGALGEDRPEYIPTSSSAPLRAWRSTTARRTASAPPSKTGAPPCGRESTSPH